MQPGFVLHRRRYGDSSLLLDVFTRDAGRLTLMAKGALKRRQRDAAGMQPFVPVLLAWRGRGEVYTLTGIDSVGEPVALGGVRLYCGLYVNELLTRLLPRHDPHIELFAAYAQVLKNLEDGAVEPTLRYFESDLLQHLGLGLRFDADQHGAALRVDRHYQYYPEQGPCLCEAGATGAVSGATLLALADRRLDQARLPEARGLMRRILNHHLGGRPLKSRELLAGMQGENDR